MIVAVVSESPADEAAIRTLLTPLVGATSAADTHLAPLRHRGWASVVKLLPRVIKALHYNTTTEALVVVVDSDDSKPHGDHQGVSDKCRLCSLMTVAAAEL